jgi:hypothetical protein
MKEEMEKQRLKDLQSQLHLKEEEQRHEEFVVNNLNTFLNSLFTFRFPDFTEREY